MPRDDSQILKRAGSLLARRGHSRWELRAKLLKTAPASQVDRVLDRLEELNLLNDNDYAYNLALLRMSHGGWGPARVRSYLLGHGVKRETVDLALERACRELDQQALIVRYAEKRLAGTKSQVGLPEVRRLIGQLRRHGFEEEAIYRSLRQILPAGLKKILETGECIDNE